MNGLEVSEKYHLSRLSQIVHEKVRVASEDDTTILSGSFCTVCICLTRNNRDQRTEPTFKKHFNDCWNKEGRSRKSLESIGRDDGTQDVRLGRLNILHTRRQILLVQRFESNKLVRVALQPRQSRVLFGQRQQAIEEDRFAVNEEGKSATYSEKTSVVNIHF
jgi:hypothetical protein